MRTMGATDSADPRNRPPAMAPPMFPMPPTTAAVKALIPGRNPVMWCTLRNSSPQRIPPIPAMVPPTAKVTTMIRFTLMPMRAAISLSSATARMARPVLVRSTRYQRPAMEAAATVTTVIFVPVIAKIRTFPGTKNPSSRSAIHTETNHRSAGTEMPSVAATWPTFSPIGSSLSETGSSPASAVGSFSLDPPRHKYQRRPTTTRIPAIQTKTRPRSTDRIVVSHSGSLG